MRPKEAFIGKVRVWDVRSFFPDIPDTAVTRRRPASAVERIVVHHDGVLMAPGDQNYNGATLDEDLKRLQAIYNRGLWMQWGGFPYHLVASPNGRLFWVRDLDTYGAHVRGQNHVSVGLALMGNFVDAMPVGRQLCAAAWGYIALWQWAGEFLPVKPHLELVSTSCPGNTHQEWMPVIAKLTVPLAATVTP